MATRMQQRRGTASEWTAANTILAAGEIGFETDTSKFKIGNGSSAWNSLPYFINDAVGANLALDALSDVDTTGVADGDALVYDTATTSWVPGSVAIDALNDIADVTITTPADGQVLTYNSGTWENQAVAIPESRPHPFTMIG